jgi:hypothetical protein
MGGTTANATAKQLAAEWENHITATPEQRWNAEAASKDPVLSLSRNHGHPAVAATPHPGLFKGPGVVAARPGNPIKGPALKVPAGRKATPNQGIVADYTLPSSKSNAAGTITSSGSNENKLLPGAMPLERKPIALSPHHTPSPSSPTASNALRSAKPVAQALRSAPQPLATKPPPPTKPKCPLGQQHC